MRASGTAFGAALGGLIALAVGLGVGRFVYTPILPFMTTELGLTPADGGLVASANFLGHLAGALAAVWIRMPGGRRAWLLAAVGLGGTVMGIVALGLIIARRMSGGDPRRIAAVMTASFGLGQIIGPAYAGYAYGIADSFRIPTLAAAVALLVAAALTARLRS